MGSTVNSDAVARSVDRLKASDLASGELGASLRAVADAITQLFDADGGGVMLVDDQQSLHYVGATSGRAAALEAAQEEAGEGPCVDSLMNNIVVATEDLGADERWPNLRAEVSELGVGAVLGVPLHLGRSAIGSLNVYRRHQGTWSEDDVGGLEAHGQLIDELLASSVWAQRQHVLVDQLTTALENRVVIDRATGVVMATKQLDAAAAFNQLRAHARARRVLLSDVAAAVVRAHTFPPPDTES